jgi:Na+/melibiose symporter-like transporter
VFLLLFAVYPPDAIALIFISQVLHGFFYGITIPLLWAMVADVADYSEWKNNRRATAIVFSAMLFGLKMGLSVGGALVAAILATYGYDASLAEQTPGTVTGIQLSISVYASLPFVVGAVALFAYEIDKKLELRIEADLAQRRGEQGRDALATD